MRVLVLGGTGFAGRAVVAEAVARGDEVTAFNRGLRSPVPGARVLVGDRVAPDGLGALASGEWDLVVDTWSADGSVVGRTAQRLRGRAGLYAYVSSRSVYAGELGGELLPADTAGYGGDKVRGELGAAEFGGPVLLGRAGLILGPGEDIGRLPWWLNRIARGGPTLAPGPYAAPLQLIDARDLALFLLGAAGRGFSGPVDLVSRSGHATMGSLLEEINAVTGGRAQLRWTDPRTILDAGVEPWTDLPIWLPPGPVYEQLHRGDVSVAYTNGLICRPSAETVADTWTWLRSLDGVPPLRPDRPAVGLDPQIERKILGL